MTKSKTLTFENDAGEYSGLSFQYILDDVLGWVIIDWLNGGKNEPVLLGTFNVNAEEYDTVFINRNLTVTLESYVQEKLTQKLNIHLNEFNYKYENTEDVGIPYLEKPTKDELDLFLKEAILTVEGVKELISFSSRTINEDSGKLGKNKSSYSAEFSIKTELGDEVWQSIEI